MSLWLKVISIKKVWLMVVPGVVALAGAGLSLMVMQQRPVRFESLHQFEEFARQNGLYVHSGRGNPKVGGNNFYIAIRPMETEEIGRLTKANCGQTHAWKGIVWVTKIVSDQGNSKLAPCSVQGHIRVWGHLLVAGDPDVLDQLEKLSPPRG